jgi:hypothetical protein
MAAPVIAEYSPQFMRKLNLLFSAAADGADNNKSLGSAAWNGQPVGLQPNDSTLSHCA